MGFLEQIAPRAAYTRAHMLRGFCRCSEGEMESEISEMFYAFGPQLNMLLSVEIVLQYQLRRKLLQFE